MNEVNPDKTVRAWLYAGPFDKDVSDLYDDNYKVPVQPYLPLLAEAEEQAGRLTPREGDELSLFGETCLWKLLRTDPSEYKMTWARFGVHARLLVTYAYTRLDAPEEGVYACRLWLAGSARIYVNGHKIFDHTKVGRVTGEFTVELPLAAGSNDVLIVLGNVHLHCMNSFSFELEYGAVPVRPSLPLLLSGKARRGLEDDFRQFYLSSGTVSGSEPVLLEWEEELRSGGLFSLILYKSVRGMPKEEVYRHQARLAGADLSLELVQADRLPESGEYLLTVDYEGEQGERIGGISLSFKKIDWLDTLPETGYSGRKRFMLERLAETGYETRSVIHRELAKMEAGLWDAVDPVAIDASLQYINDRYDCADFALHGLLRMYAKHADGGHIPPELKERMKACILGFKYWVDEPGRSMMFTRSENHEILFYSAEYIAGLMFPGEHFPNSGQNGLFHALKGQLKSERWIKEKGTYGYMEWHSNTYYEEDMLALLNLHDFGEENGYLRILARQLLDLTVAIMASHSYKGVMATTHGRSYEDSIIHPELESMSHLNWLLFGQPKRLAKKLSIGCVALAGSGYSPNPEWERVASSEEELFTLTRMGLFPDRGMDGVNCATYRTKDYMLSGMVGSKKGQHGGQVHAGQALLDGTVPVFVTCFDNKSEMTRPSYWGGQYLNPKTIAHKNVLAYIYRLGKGPGYTHCYFPFDRFDETAELGGWLFGRKNEAYIAVYSQRPYTKTTSGKYKNCELLCMEKDNIWLFETGSLTQSGPFSQFVKSVTDAKLSAEDEGLLYVSSSLGPVVLDYDKTCSVGGQPVPERDDGYPLISNRYAHGEYGTGITKLQLESGVKILNFLI
ncbi:hypothetical protein [Paenibacillus piri]|uniref:Ig-like domain-containing protein n=1 Tax=Paenibacillus piri TaxID=2547395 RepID=A0A4R5KG43_9BACL|nr:hypothetical protein [Paenibacillus piri]TDF94379.1 hypothetical protein E1757_23465 [Paenibacillus piri]